MTEEQMGDGIDKHQMVKRIVTYLNFAKVRCTYGAVAGVLGVAPVGVGSFLGPAHSEYSWIVAKNGPQKGLPTDYEEKDIHPDFDRASELIERPEDLLERIRAFEAAECTR